MRELIRPQSACNQHAISTQSARTQHALSTHSARNRHALSLQSAFTQPSLSMPSGAAKRSVPSHARWLIAQDPVEACNQAAMHARTRSGRSMQSGCDACTHKIRSKHAIRLRCMHAQDPVEAPSIQPRPPARIERRNHLMREAIRDHQHALKGTQRRIERRNHRERRGDVDGRETMCKRNGARK